VPPPELSNPPYELIVATAQPLVDLVLDFIDAAKHEMNTRVQMPGADGRIMADIVNEQAYIDPVRLAEPVPSIAMVATLPAFAGQESL
jgi:hypothetical protein